MKFIRKHWAASLALLLAILTAVAVVAAVVAFPPSLVAIAGLSVFGATPLAFLGAMALPAAAATVGAITFGASLAASTLFNAVVGIYNFMDRLISPKKGPQGPQRPQSQFVELTDEPRTNLYGNSTLARPSTVVVTERKDAVAPTTHFSPVFTPATSNNKKEEETAKLLETSPVLNGSNP